MSEADDWTLPEHLRPKPEDWGFDLDRALSAVVAVRSEVPADAFTASVLGTEREGNGVVIDERGLVLTIGYLVTEAETVWLTTNDGRALPADVLAYDQSTGFGLVQALGRLDLPALDRSSSRSLEAGDPVIVAGHGGRAHALHAHVDGKDEFAGYWEYLLDEAIFTAPAHPHWGGAALIGRDGRLCGIGSLLIQDSQAGRAAVDRNMVVPIELLDPILEAMRSHGAAERTPRPWLGLYAADAEAGPSVLGLAAKGPAAQAGIEPGDVILQIAGEPVDGLADFYRKVWARGPAGSEIPVTLLRDDQPVAVALRSADRNDFLKKPHLH